MLEDKSRIIRSNLQNKGSYIVKMKIISVIVPNSVFCIKCYL